MLQFDKLFTMIKITNVYIDKKIETEIEKVLSSKNLVQGEKVKKFEEQLSKINDAKYAVVVNSGTAALHTALAAIGITEGGEVITSPFSFIATVNAILMCGAKPVFVDVKEDTFTINPDLIESKISNKTKAILTVDLYGQACDYENIRKIARKHKLKIVSDSCQAIGACYKNKPISKWVDIACFSFYATKNICMGEGGAIVTNDRKFFEFARRFRQHGQDMEKPYIYHHIGYNYRSTDILAAIGLMQIRFLRKWTNKRQSNAKRLISKLKDIPGIILPILAVKGGHVFHQFSIRVTNDFQTTRDELQQYLLKKGIKTGIYYPATLASQLHIQKITPYKKGMYPVAEKITREVLSLPVHPMLKNHEIDRIADAIRGMVNEKN